MRSLDFADLVALAVEVSDVEAPKLLELLDTPEIEALLAEAGAPRAPHEAAATLLVGLVGLAPLPTGSRRLGLLAALQLLAVNGIDVALDPPETQAMLAGVATGSHDAAAVVAWLDRRVTARDPLEGALRELLAADAWWAIGGAVLRSYRHGRRLATPADLAIGLFREGTGPGALALGAAGRETDPSALPPAPNVPARIPAFEPETRRILELAFRASVVLGHHEINTGHLLLGLLDAGHDGVLPEELDRDAIRRRVLELLGPGEPEEGELSGRLARVAARLRTTDPEAAAELDEVADLQRIGLDRLLEMVRAWRGEIFLDALARDTVVARLLGPHRLGPTASLVANEHLLATYLADIARYTRLTRDEERELVDSIRTGTETQAAERRRRLIQSNLQLVVSIARTYETSGLSVLDLVQEGNLGLMQAAEHFDPTRGFRFGTYATWWVRRSILEAIARRQR